jgi:hypothetical protein
MSGCCYGTNILGETNLVTGTLKVTGSIDNNILNAETSTGVSSGGVLSLVGAPDASPLFDISDGSGVISDGVNAPVHISWSGLTNQDGSPYTGTLTYVSIQAGPTVIYQSTEPTNAELRDRIFLGVLVHITSPSNPSGLNLTTINNQQLTNRHNANQIHDVFHALGFLNFSGNLLSAPSTDLSISKSAGVMVQNGINYENDINDPHFLNLPAIDTNASGTFQYLDQFNNRSALTSNLLVPGVYDDGVDPGSYPPSGSVGVNKWVAHRVFSFTSNALKIQFGQFVYNSAAEAKGGIQTEDYVTEPSVNENGMLIGFIILRGGAVNTSLSTDCEFLSAGKFGNSISSVSGGTTTLQQAYDNSGVEPEILTNSTRGALTLRRGSALDSDNVIEIQNNVGTNKLELTGDGSMILSHIATEADSYTLEIIHDSATFADTKAIDIVYDAGNLSAGDEEGILISLDKSSTSGGNIAGFLLASTEGAANCVAIESGAGCDIIEQLSGSFVNPSPGTIDDNGVSENLATLGTNNVQLWANNSEYVIVGHNAEFEEIEFLLKTVASGGGIAPTFEFSSGTGPLAWTSFTPIDGSNGLRNNGVVIWLPSDVPGWITDGGLYKIRITRNRATLSTNPIANDNGIKIAAITEYYWDQNGDLNVNSVDATSYSENGTSGEIAKKINTDTVYVGGGTNLAASADENTIYGCQAGDSNVSGDQNTYIGASAGRYNTGADNVALGARAYQGQSGLTTGNFNTCVGGQTMYTATTASGNTCLGARAGNIITEASDCTIVGSFTGNSITTGGENTLIGKGTAGLLTTGIRNTIIGRSANVSGAAATNQIAIGYNTSTSSDNTCKIGNGITEIITTTTDACSLGSSSVKFDNLYLSGNITANKSYGEMFKFDNATSTNSVNNSGWFYIQSDSASSGNLNDFSVSMSTNNPRLTYDGAPTKKFLCNYHLTIDAITTREVRLSIIKSGTVLESVSENRGWCATTSPFLQISTSCVISLVTNDWVTIGIREANSVSENLTVVDWRLTITEI